MSKKRTLLLLLTAVVLGIAAWLIWFALAPASSELVGSVGCRDCHEPFYRLWSTSFHGLAMQPVTPDFVRKTLSIGSREIAIDGRRYQAQIAPNEGWIVERGPETEKRYRIEYSLGGKDVFYFLTALDRGRLQVLPLALNARTKQWIDTTESMVRHFPTGDRSDAPLPWTDRLLTFNTSCHGCHVSQMSQQYDPSSDSYHTTWTEPGINCETCHGPGGEHVQVTREAGRGGVPSDLKIIRMKEFTVDQKNDSCGSCHAKASPITPTFQPKEAFFDHFDLVTLENLDFYPDGRDLGENYTITGWRMSACVKAGGFDCLKCHTSGGRYRFQEEARANEACLPCHEDKVKDPASHTHHRVDGEASRCVRCHMPMTEFALMRRTDHSMRPPSPSATIAFKSPNACNLCHDDKTPEWADRAVRQWHKHDYQGPLLDRARLIEAARERDWSKLPAMLAYIVSRERDEIFATSLIRLLANCPDERKWPPLRAALTDPSPLIRSAAASELKGNLGDFQTREALIRAAGDSRRLVRIRAAGALAECPAHLIPESSGLRVDAAFEELEKALQSRPDDWSANFSLGNFYLERNQLNQARLSFERATRLRPDTLMPWVNLSITCARLGDNAGAEQALRGAQAVQADSTVVNFNLALLKADKGETAEAERLLRKALETEPGMAEAAYNLGVLLGGKGEYREAVLWCRRAAELRPEDARYADTLALYLRKLEAAHR